jgi:molybdopterin molybdotransferase
MKEFFSVTTLERVLAYKNDFPRVETETVPLTACLGRVLAADVTAHENLPQFSRSTMDGYAVNAASSFGASEANPAYLIIRGAVAMGETPDFKVKSGEAARIATGGMLPKGTNSVVMIEHTEAVDTTSVEVYKSVAPGQNIVEAGEDFSLSSVLMSAGSRLRPQDIGLLAAFGHETITVFRRPVVGIISTGDEIVPISATPGAGQVRDVNLYSLSGQVLSVGAGVKGFGIVADNFNALKATCAKALESCDMLMISGGSSVGMRDFTMEVLNSLPQTRVLVHGISISPGKPTILAKAGHKPFWGLPGHVTSAMVVFAAVVKPFIDAISGCTDTDQARLRLKATLSRNVSSAQGRVDFLRVKLRQENDILWADPVLGKSGLINTMVKSDGLVAIGLNTEGVDKGDTVEVMPF